MSYEPPAIPAKIKKHTVHPTNCRIDTWHLLDSNSKLASVGPKMGSFPELPCFMRNIMINQVGLGFVEDNTESLKAGNWWGSQAGLCTCASIIQYPRGYGDLLSPWSILRRLLQCWKILERPHPVLSLLQNQKIFVLILEVKGCPCVANPIKLVRNISQSSIGHP